MKARIFERRHVQRYENVVVYRIYTHNF